MGPVDRTAAGPSALALGEVLDRTYEIGPVLGRGAMATVYEGRILETDSPVAIKVLLGTASTRENQERFFNELLLATTVRHPRVVEVFDFGIAGDDHYIVMERLQGRTVGQELRRVGRLDPARAVPRILEILDGSRPPTRAASCTPT
jgi:serine/threonine-protein kinase